MMKFFIGVIALALLSTTALAADMVTATPRSLHWGDAPDAFPKGAKLAVISGDPSKSGPYVLRFRMPAGYRIAAHNHPTTENVTVISGNFHIGAGDKLDPKNGTELKTGGFVSLPAMMNHYAWTSSPTVVQVHGDGPFTITYVNPADDPRNKK